jgi:hypothetical protein
MKLSVVSFGGNVLAQYFLVSVFSFHLSTARSGGVELFHETFNGYSSFPSQIPSGDYVNTGIPLTSEGADEFWYGVRFQSGSGTIDSDLAVQQFGGGTNQTPVGRFEDDAGIVLRVDTTGYANVNLSFSWRTFLAETTDRFTVGYHVGDNLGFATSGVNRYRDLSPSGWSQWTQLLSASANNSFQIQSFTLPGNAGPVYVAFWMNNGESDYGKVDNVVISADVIPVPEPATTNLIILSGVMLLIVCRRRSRTASEGAARWNQNQRAFM